MLYTHRNGHSHQSADGNGLFYIHMKKGKYQHDHNRQQHQRSEIIVIHKQVPGGIDSRAGMDGKAENSIQNTTEYEGNQSTACHIPDIGKKIRFCQFTDKKRTGGNRRTPVPARIAPPVRKGGIPILLAIVIQITPMVAALPKEVPVRKEIRQHRRKDASSITEGVQMADA